MTWTMNKPTQPGWYWVRMTGSTPPWIVEILPGELLAEGREWAGPIPEPVERDERVVCGAAKGGWMTRDEFENKIELILDSDTGADCTVVFDELIAHNDEQRAVIANLERDVLIARNLASMSTDLLDERNKQIEQQAKEIARLKGELDHWSYIRFNQLEQENKTIREALQLLYDCQNGCPLPKYETDWHRAMELAQKALKECV